MSQVWRLGPGEGNHGVEVRESYLAGAKRKGLSVMSQSPAWVLRHRMFISYLGQGDASDHWQKEEGSEAGTF